MEPDPAKILTISAKRMWDTCPRKHYYRYRLGLDQREVPKPLARGIEFHEDARAIYAERAEITRPIDAETAEISAKGLGYKAWAESGEQFVPLAVESPILVPLSALYEYIDEDCPTDLEEYQFGGVIDVAGLYRGESWILDHKSVESFYPLPELYSTEQLAMYTVAAELAWDYKPRGGIISRVKLVESTHPKRYLNYVTKQLQKLDIAVTYTELHRLQRKALRTLRIRRHEVPNDTGTLHIRLSGTDAGLGINVARYDEAGRIVYSLQKHDGILVHIQRHYYVFSPEQKHNIVSDFLAFAEAAYWPENYGMRHTLRRSPGLHCGQCPFREPCLEARSTHQDAPESILLPRDDLCLQPPNVEVLEALQRVPMQQSLNKGVDKTDNIP